MATFTRTITRSTFRSTSSTIRSTAARTARANIPRPTLCQTFRRGYASEAAPKTSNAKFTRPPPPPPRSGPGASSIFLGVGFVTVVGAGYYVYLINTATASASYKADASNKPGASDANSQSSTNSKSTTTFTPTFDDYQKVYNTVAKRLEDYDEYEDGSYAPIVLRLGWHSSGTYDKETGTGGSNGATMRFSPEGGHGANAGLQIAREFLEPVKEQYPWISHGDLWTLSAVCAIQEMQGPIVPWRPGRQDRDISYCTPDGRLPDGAKTQDHLRHIFYRMGFNDQEIVALSGAHAVGRCHHDRSGFDGPWTFSPTVITNDYFKLLLEEKWHWREWEGPKQWQDENNSLMMLPSDMALVQDDKFRPYVEKYANDNDAFFKDFSAVVVKLFENGVPFTVPPEKRWTFTPQTGLE